MKPVSDKDRMVPVGVTVPLSMLKKIDGMRGKEPRSPFVRRLLRKALELRKVKTQCQE